MMILKGHSVSSWPCLSWSSTPSLLQTRNGHADVDARHKAGREASESTPIGAKR
jgi:hypothetical protein